jgi:hypothetical protein
VSLDSRFSNDNSSSRQAQLTSVGVVHTSLDYYRPDCPTLSSFSWSPMDPCRTSTPGLRSCRRLLDPGTRPSFLQAPSLVSQDHGLRPQPTSRTLVPHGTTIMSMTHLNIFTYDSKRLNLHFISSSTFSAFRQQRPCSSYDKRPSLRSRPRIQPCNF